MDIDYVEYEAPASAYDDLISLVVTYSALKEPYMSEMRTKISKIIDVEIKLVEAAQRDGIAELRRQGIKITK